MTLKSTAELVSHARAAGTAVMAFNIITLEHLEAVAAAATAAGQPAIIQISQNASRYHGGLEPLAAAARAVAQIVNADLAMHLDHVDDDDLLHQAADLGFGSAMFDASSLPYPDNVAATAAAADWAHARGLWLEAELGYIGGKPDSPSDPHAAGTRTDPAEAARFVAATNVDALAVAVGSSHAMTDQSAVIDTALVADLRAAVQVPLVLHGSSGVSDHQLLAAVASGITKVNVGTALNIAFTDTLRRHLLAGSTSVDPRQYLGLTRDAMTATVGHLLTLTGMPLSSVEGQSRGHADGTVEEE